MVGNWSHVFRYEQGSAAQFANVFIHNLQNAEDGTFSIDEVKNNIRGGDIHEPITQLVVIEQTHNMAGKFQIWCQTLRKHFLCHFEFSYNKKNRWQSNSS
jgi:threonine aldolase